METLENEKFMCLSNEEMSEIHGGIWGWHIDSIDISLQPDGEGCWTTTTWTHYNIWGNPDNYDQTVEPD